MYTQKCLMVLPKVSAICGIDSTGICEYLSIYIGETFVIRAALEECESLPIYLSKYK